MMWSIEGERKAMKDEEGEKDRPRVHFIGVGLALGSGVGVALGVALGNIAVGIAVGVGIGIALGAAMSLRGRQ